MSETKTRQEIWLSRLSPERPDPLLKYNYVGYVTGVRDGDSIRVACHMGRKTDVGFGIMTKPIIVTRKFRLLGVDTPELKKPTYDEGADVRDAVRE
jgi:endonuclease YncB( thermonuclease family)